MTEWAVVGVIITLLGLVAAVVKPLITLNTTLTKLTDSVATLDKNITALTTDNTASHARIWGELNAHDETINDHETRISIIEHKGA